MAPKNLCTFSDQYIFLQLRNFKNSRHSDSFLVESVAPISDSSRSSPGSVLAVSPSLNSLSSQALLDENVVNLRRNLQNKIKRELETLSQLQLEVSRLTEYLLTTQSKLEQIDNNHHENTDYED